MAHGQRTAGAVQGAAVGVAAGPIGAAVGAGLGYGLASIGSIFGKKKKKPKAPKQTAPKAASHATLYVVLGVAGVVLIGGVVLIVVARSRKG